MREGEEIGLSLDFAGMEKPEGEDDDGREIVMYRLLKKLSSF